MRIKQSAALSPELTQQAQHIGQLLTELRQARRMKQSEAALRAGISRASAVRVERGDAGTALGILLRYLGAIAPGLELRDLLEQNDPSLIALKEELRPKRVRDLTATELMKLNF